MDTAAPYTHGYAGRETMPGSSYPFGIVLIYEPGSSLSFVDDIEARDVVGISR